TYNWNADSGDRWQVPLGLTAGKTFDVGGGYALDMSLGGYGLAVKPEGGADWQLKFGVSLIFP
ncbi:MAG: neuromedin U, partial [Phycisphaerae bacterium]